MVNLLCVKLYYLTKVYRLAILGLTYQYVSSRISAQKYEAECGLFSDEVARLNPLPDQADDPHALLSVNPDDASIRSSVELRFALLRHWTLYDSMYHSSYVAGKLGLWKEKGKTKLSGLLAKMGCVDFFVLWYRHNL